MLPTTDLVLSTLTPDDLGDRTARPVAQALLATLPEAVRRARLGEYLNDEQAQEETGLNKRQLRYLREERKIAYKKCGRTVLYRTAELFAFIESGAVPAREPIPA